MSLRRRGPSERIRIRARKRNAKKLPKQSWGGGEFTEDENLNPTQPSDLLFPDLREHHLSAVLEKLKMKFDREGQRRSSLMIALKNHIDAKGLNQSQAAALFKVTQPRVSDRLRGKITLFSLDTLVNMVVAVGLHVEVKVAEAT